MELTGKQIGELADALTSAFTSSSLARMLTTELDKRLDLLSGPDDLTNVTFQLVLTAEREGWTEDLIRGARRANPGNEQLKQIATALLPPESSTDPADQGMPQDKKPSQPTVPAIDPDDPPILQIRTLLQNAYSATTLRQFCNNRKRFRQVLLRIGPNEGLDGMIDEVLEYCRTNLLWQELLEGIATEQPEQFERFFQT